MDIPKNPIIVLAPYLNSLIEVSLVNETVITGKLENYDKYNNMILNNVKERTKGNKAESSLNVTYIKGSSVR